MSYFFQCFVSHAFVCQIGFFSYDDEQLLLTFPGLLKTGPTVSFRHCGIVLLEIALTDRTPRFIACPFNYRFTGFPRRHSEAVVCRREAR